MRNMEMGIRMGGLLESALLIVAKKKCLLIMGCKTLTKPVAYMVILSSINQHFDVVFKELRNSNFKVPHPI
jgi:hypothetical protein